MDNDLGNHRVVIPADHIALPYACIDPDRRTHIELCGRFRKAKRLNLPHRGQKASAGILGVKPCFDGMALGLYMFPMRGQGLTHGNLELPSHQIFAQNHLSDRVLDLQAGVHFHEEKITGWVDDEFHGACPDILHRARRGDGRHAHGPTLLRAPAGCRRFFNHFLMSSLQAAIALKQ